MPVAAQIPQNASEDSFNLLLDEYSESVSLDITERAKEIYPKIASTKIELSEKLDALEAAEPKDVFPRILRAAEGNRQNMLRNLRAILDDIQLPEVTDYTTISTFYSNVTTSIVRHVNISSRSSKHVHFVYPDATLEVMSKLKVLEALFVSLMEPVNEKQSTLDLISQTRSDIDAVELQKKELSSTKDDISELKSKIKEGQDNSQGISTAIETLMKSKDYLEYQTLKVQLDGLTGKLTENGAEAAKSVSIFAKAFKRLKQLSESGRYVLDPEITQALNDCINDSKGAIKDPVNTNKLLSTVESALKSGEIKLKEKQEKNMLESIHYLISNKTFKKLHETKERLISEREGIEGKISDLGVTEKLKRLEAELDSSKSKVNEMEERLLRLEHLKASAEEKINSTTDRIKKSLEELKTAG